MNKRSLVTCIFYFLIFLIFVPLAHAVPYLVNYQGKLSDSGGAPFDDLAYMVFSIYTLESGGSLLYSEEHATVTVDNGIYSVHIGSGTPLAGAFDPDLFLDDTWLEVAIEGETLSPRQRITSTPYAIQASNADTLDGINSTLLDQSAHLLDTGNPHNVTASQAGAVPIGEFDWTNLSGIPAGFADNVDNDSGGDITGVTAGNGLTGGGASGTVTVHAGAGTGISVSADAISLNTTYSDGRYVNAGEVNSVSSGMIQTGAVGSSDVQDNSLTYLDLADNSVRESEIQWSLDYSGSDLNGGLISLTNSSASDGGNYPMGVSGAVTGTPVSNPVIGVFGGAPGLGQGGPVGLLPDSKIGVAGVSDTGYGVVGVSSTGHGGYFVSAGLSDRAVEGYATNTGSTYNYGGRFQADGAYGIGAYGYSPNYWGVYGYGEVRGIYGYASGTTGTGIYGYAVGTDAYGGYFSAYNTNGIGIYAYGGSNGYAADFRGNVRIRDRSTGNTVIELGTGLDYAEGFDVSRHQEITPGSVLIIDPDNPGQLALSINSYDSKVAGIVAGANNLGSGIRLGAGQFDYDVALAGRVYCNVDASETDIVPGDLLTTSNLPGFAMKCTDRSRAHGSVLGKAMQGLAKGQKGQILVLVTLQ